MYYVIIFPAPTQLSYTYNNQFCSKTAPEQRWKFLLTSVLHSRPRRIQWRIVIGSSTQYLVAICSLSSSKQAHICTTETWHFPEITDSIQYWKMLFTVFTGGGCWSYGPCEQIGVIRFFFNDMSRSNNHEICLLHSIGYWIAYGLPIAPVIPLWDNSSLLYCLLYCLLLYYCLLLPTIASQYCLREFVKLT